MKRSLGAHTVLYPAPVLIVGTYDAVGQPNMMAAAWGGICCSRPPCVYVSLRKATYTHGAILARGCYTISIPPERYAAEADYVGIASGRDVNKFDVTGLTPMRAEHVDAPYVGEFPVVLEVKLLQAIELGSHTQFVGQVLDVKADEDCLNAAGHPDLALVRPIIFAPLATEYYGVGQRLGEGFVMGEAVGKR
jgi:flavin reductase (DIM6/NTAB) family NADH-FMN oxidoreductase RutF